MQLPLFTYLSDPSCGTWRCQGWRRTCCRGDTPTPPQVYLLHVCTNGGIGGWWALPATLNLSLVYTLDAPYWMQRGCILAGIFPSKTKGAVEEVDSSACSAGPGASGSLDSWGAGWEMVADGVWWTFLWGGGAEDMEECDIAPFRSP